MSKILIPVDFSECSINALRYGLEQAEKLNAEVAVVHGYHIPIPAAEFSMSLGPAVIESFKTEAEDKFISLKNEIPLINALKVDFKVKMAFALDAILSSIEEENADMTIMGTKGSSGIAEVVLGSNTSGVIKESGKPVIAVPANYSDPKISKIILAFDYAPLKELVKLNVLKEMAATHRADIEVLHITKDEKAASVDNAKQAIQLDEYFKNIPHSFKYSKSDDIAEGLENYINESKAGLLAMIPRKHDLITRLFKTSMTKKMAHHCQIPLLALPA